MPAIVDECPARKNLPDACCMLLMLEMYIQSSFGFGLLAPPSRRPLQASPPFILMEVETRSRIHLSNNVRVRDIIAFPDICQRVRVYVHMNIYTGDYC